MENDMQYHVTGSMPSVCLTPDIILRKFECQSDNNKYYDHQKPPYKPFKQRVMAIEECVNELAETNAASLFRRRSLIPEDTLSGSSGTMTDEIDIEEHDVLDNPAIRNIFPDLTVIKQEIKSYEEDLEIVDEHELANNELESNFNEFQNVYTDNEIYLRREDESMDKANNPCDTSINNFIQSTKIILGTKPKTKLDYAEFEENVKSYEPKLQLLDMKPYLERSDRFCRQCLILFPNKQYFDIHVKKTHTVINNKVKNPIMCTKCNIKFTAHTSLIRHCRNFHSNNQSQKKTTAKKVHINMNGVKKSDFSGSHACFHCKKEFLTQQSLIQHLYKVIQSQNHRCSFCSKKFASKADFDHHILWHKKNNISLKDHPNGLHKTVNHSNLQLLEETTDKDPCKSLRMNLRGREREQDSRNLEYGTIETKNKKEIFNTNVDFYRCHICHYYFKDTKCCLEHMAMKHKMTGNTNTLKSVKFDSFCNICQSNYNDINLYNCHISLFHYNHIDQQNIDVSQLCLGRNMKDESLLLKSSLFRCTKCDIHFLSAEVARHHTNHMEMLTNWKCNQCMRFFKKEDEWRHTQQHLFPNLTVHDLCPDSHYLVLFNCLKCTVYFDENHFLEHYSRCETETPQAVYCKYCDLLIDESISKSHETGHVSKHIRNSDIIIVNSDVITIKDRTVEQLDEINDTEKISKVCKYANNIQDDRKQNELKGKLNRCLIEAQKTKKRNLNSLNELTYCDTCKLFLINRFTRNMHIAGHCQHLRKHVCRVCGLVFPSQHYKTHKKLHSKMKRCKLQNFKFFDIGGKLISPPIPEYPKCEKCEVVTISRLVGSHDCNKVDYLTCHSCEMKLTEEAFKLHMLFHNFSKKSSANECNNTPERLSSQWNFEEEETSKLTEKSYLLNLLYECKNCNTTVDTYDKAVEHSQGHYSGEWKNIETVKCEYCNKIFDKTCYGMHQKLHLSQSETINFTTFNFDSIYLTSENSIWLKHVFCGLTQTQTNAIIRKSIYKSECRIKMKVIQDGPPNLTVYKCDKCCSYIDESSLYKHADNSCFKLRKHHCSICNLPFISSFARTQHEQIHTDPNIGWKSYRNYRIVIFNKEEDNKINKLLYYRSQYYVLYRCRNCHVSVDEMQTRNHKCNSQILKCCKFCGLLIYEDHYKTHIERHEDLTNFTKNKIKVILFGEILKNTTNRNQEKDNFNGIVCDYTLYSCKRCQVVIWNQSAFTVVKSVEPPSKHTCSSVSIRSKCHVCDLSFLTSKLKYHHKFHENDLEFVRENMRIIMFDITEYFESKSKDESCIVTTKFVKQQQPFDTDVTSENPIPNLENDNVEKTAKIYKCNCDLHFLDRESMLSHFKTCSPKIRVSKQKCFKCGLLFTQKNLFNHLLKHHGRKNETYRFEIIDLE